MDRRIPGRWDCDLDGSWAVRLSGDGWAHAPVLVARSPGERRAGLRPLALGWGLLLGGAAVHGRGMAEPLTVVGIDAAGTVTATTTLLPGRWVRLRDAAALLELPADVGPPLAGTVLGWAPCAWRRNRFSFPTAPRTMPGMCRNITELRGLEPAATDEEIEAAARQYVRKVSGLNKAPAAASRCSSGPWPRSPTSRAGSSARCRLGVSRRRRSRRCAAPRSSPGSTPERRALHPEAPAAIDAAGGDGAVIVRWASPGSYPYPRPGMPGRLVLCATPIGNLDDVSARLSATLAAADAVFAEDTRRTRAFLGALHITPPPLRSFFSGNENRRLGELRSRLEAGETVVLVTDAGTPAVADPGLSAVRVADEVGAKVTVIPGPSAVTTAVALSGLPSERFVFEDSCPAAGPTGGGGSRSWRSRSGRWCCSRPPGGSARIWRLWRTRWETTGWWWWPVSSRRSTRSAGAEPWREAIAHWSVVEPRGEFTLVVAPLVRAKRADLTGALDQVRALRADGLSLPEAVKQAAVDHEVDRRLLYQETVAEREPSTGPAEGG